MRFVLGSAAASMISACTSLAQVGVPDGDPPGSPAAPTPASAAAASTNTAEAGAAPGPPEERTWDGFHLDLTAGLWLPRVTGTVASDDSQFKYDLVDDVGLSGQDAAFAGDLQLRWGAWRLRFGGSQFSQSGGRSSTSANTLGGVGVLPGDPTASSLTMWNFGGDLGVDLWRPFADRPFPLGPASSWAREHNTRPDGGYRGDLSLGAFVGARAIGTDLGFTNLRTQRSASIEETWTAVYVGGRVSLDLWLRDHFPLLERINIDGNAAFGPAYPGSGSLLQIAASLTMFPCDNFGVQLGYRLLKIDGDGGGQKLDANFAGLFVGGVLHF